MLKIQSEKKQEYIVIDGQQRITTISILILAFRTLIENDVLKLGETPKNILLKKIGRALFNDEEEVKLRPAPNSIEAYNLLFKGMEDEFIENSNVTENYRYFTKRFEDDKDDFTADDFWNAIDNLIIIDIYLETDDNAQLIFESINSTGLDLTESDKIRNYLMMSLDIKEQEHYYADYWKKIEENTTPRCDNFIRDFLTIQTHNIPAKYKIYDTFKTYARNQGNDPIIKSMLRFSKYYRDIYHPEKADEKFRKALAGFRKLDMGVADPYLMQLLEGYYAGNIPENEVNESLAILENYIFRRNICGVQTNALNKVFQTLHTDALKLRGNTDDYSERISYVLMKKEWSGRFPRDTEFLSALQNRNIYTELSEKYKLYLLEQLECFDNNEAPDISKLTAENKCSIEHVMPQTLTDVWINELGGPENAKRIHDKWQHKLGNLTFTGYNSKYSNQPFATKLTMEHGFKDSTFSLNKFIGSCTKWTEEELIRRTELLIEKVKKIWKEPHTDFVEDAVVESGLVNLAENYNFTGKVIKGFTLEKAFYPVKSWKEFIILITQLLYEKDKRIIEELSRTTAAFGPANFIVASGHDFAAWKTAELKDGIYLYTHTSTWYKIKFLKDLLDLYEIPHSSVELNIKNSGDWQPDTQDLSLKFWERLLPVLKEKTSLYNSRSPTKKTWLTVPSKFMPGMRYRIIFNAANCIVGFEYYSSDKEQNLKYFDLIHSQKESIEEAFGDKLSWERNADKVGSFVNYYSQEYSLENEETWDGAIAFITEKLPKFYNAFQPVLDMYRKTSDSASDSDDEE